MASSIIYAFCIDSAFFYLNWYLLVTGNRATIIPTKLCDRILKDIKYRIWHFDDVIRIFQYVDYSDSEMVFIQKQNGFIISIE